jgi:hypothetical protein
MTLCRTLIAALAAAALIAPAAAQAEPADMHASVATAAAKARAKQDLRSPDARDAAQPLRRGGGAVNASGATAADSASLLPVAGQSTTAQKPATDADGSPLLAIVLLGGALVALAAAFTARYGPRRLHRRARIAS